MLAKRKTDYSFVEVVTFDGDEETKMQNTKSHPQHSPAFFWEFFLADWKK